MSRNVEKIKYFRYWVQKTLPAVYDDSLSYYELLAKVVAQLNAVIDGHNGLVDITDALNSSVATLDAKVDRVVTTIDTFVNTVNQKFDDFKTDFTNDMEAEMNTRFGVQDSKIDGIESRVGTLETDMSDFKSKLETDFNELENALTDTINNQLIILRDYVTTSSTELKLWVNEQIEQLIHDLPDLQNVYVYDISTGELISVQSALYNLYCYLGNSITATELNEIGITANNLDNWMVNSIPRGMKALDFDTRGRQLLLEKYDYLVESNVTGDKVRSYIYRAEQDNIDKDMNALTASEFEAYAVEGIEHYVNTNDIGVSAFDWSNIFLSDVEV